MVMIFSSFITETQTVKSCVFQVLSNASNKTQPVAVQAPVGHTNGSIFHAVGKYLKCLKHLWSQNVVVWQNITLIRSFHKSTFQTHLSPSRQRVFPQCAAAGASSADRSGQMPFHSLGNHTDRASLLGGKQRNCSGNSIGIVLQFSPYYTMYVYVCNMYQYNVNTKRKGHCGTTVQPSFLQAPAFLTISRDIVMFLFFQNSLHPPPYRSHLCVFSCEPEETSLWETLGCRCCSEYGWTKSPPRL